MHVCSGLPGAVPLDQELEGGFEAEVRFPAEVGVGAGSVEFEVAGLVDAFLLIEDPGGSVAPEGGHLFDDPAHGFGVVVVGAEVIGGGVAGWVVGEEVLGEGDVSGEGFHDVLPGTDGVRAANADGLSGEESADEVGDEAID